jgi:D-tyrosyl-tRNA(Tyr) deacylase
MIAVIQRVSEGAVSVNDRIVGAIEKGLLILLGIETVDQPQDAEWLIKKIISLRIFGDESGVMNLSVSEVSGEILIISQFTLHASTKKGNRPSYIKAAKPDIAIPLYQYFLEKCELELGRTIASGEFGADMQVSLVNDGPVTIIIDSRNRT